MDAPEIPAASVRPQRIAEQMWDRSPDRSVSSVYGVRSADHGKLEVTL